jgi:hypothetical protein
MQGVDASTRAPVMRVYEWTRGLMFVILSGLHKDKMAILLYQRPFQA